ncbi:hypothetical protein KDU71_05170 [Carboxylicivirga sediminis]|uniref:Uncharacterized protein n=1 Tax=Carboxylicivirga sediminis TaxID=2006564 RepID=A0A941IWW8_9BACT|nr:hypothetical protein [Carboxylicivirga sediminis]MBR8534943.1 hypothetical protein [Carboxylicivirga sediminis]
MDKRLNNRFNMYKVVRDWLTANREALGALPGLSESIDEFAAVLAAVAALDVTKGNGLSAASDNKNAARELLERRVMDTVRMLKAYAVFSENGISADELDMSASSLKRLAEMALLSRSQRVIQLAEAYQEAAAPYGLDAAAVDGLKQAHQQFDQKQTAVRSAIVNRKDAGEQLEARMDEADDLLKGKLDVLMEVVAINQPELYNQYRGARVIVDR